MENTFFALKWFEKNGWKPFPFQKSAWNYYLQGYSGVVNAPTGSGKTYSLLLPALLESKINNDTKGVKLIWVTPIRALSKEINLAAQRAIEGFQIDWEVGIRNGDTSPNERQKQWKNPPQLLITTPESLHVMMCKKKYESFFKTVKAVVVDEWHELVGSKRGVQTELFLSRMKGINADLKVWGISATIGNMQEAIDVLLGIPKPKKWTVVKATFKKKIEVIPVMPDEIERYPWSGHLGLKMVEKVVPIIKEGKTTLIFTNTRAQSEIWYQNILEVEPSLAGQIAVHHGSISREIRDWVEDALYDGRLKGVVCTSSLDLGVDFRPVENIIQIGSPKGVARFIQRAGRSGHRPGETSRIYFVPTHSLELIEAAALREAIENQSLEERIPYIRSFDVLIQYLMTLAVSDGFEPDSIYKEVKTCYCFTSITEEEWQQVLSFLIHGSKSLAAYDEYNKIGFYKGKYLVKNKYIAQRHKLSIGTIVSDAMLTVKFVKGKKIGSIEEYFLAQLAPGDTFWFAGQALELVRIKEMQAQVIKSSHKNGRIPSYMGGRMPLSTEMSKVLRKKLDEFEQGNYHDPEVKALVPLFELQQERSILPSKDRFVVEYFETSEGYHLVMYPFEGRQVHEGIGALIGQRLSEIQPMSISIAMNDYGLELLSDTEIDVEAILTPDLFSTKNLELDIQASINAVEMSRRRFRDIAKISGLIFQGFPGREKRERHLQSSSSLLFDVFREYEPDNLLYLQTYDEVMTFQLEEARMRNALNRIQNQEIILVRPEKVSPFAFPLIVDMLNRERISSETLEDRIEKMKIQLVN
jgi:ATP-dependent Lhr-like helicase